MTWQTYADWLLLILYVDSVCRSNVLMHWNYGEHSDMARTRSAAITLMENKLTCFMLFSMSAVLSCLTLYILVSDLTFFGTYFIILLIT